MKPRKIIHYTDELHDDFAGNHIHPQVIGDQFRYGGRPPLWNLMGAFLYRLIAFPIAWLYCHLWFHVRIQNKQSLRQLRKTGYFLYANHSQTLHDAFEPSLISFPKKCHIITSADAVSIPFLRNIVLMLGAIPFPGSLTAAKNFRASIHHAICKNHAIMIYPEAHIWPYYTGVRNFSADSFIYPVRLNAPVVAVAIKYRQRHIFRRLPPCITVILSDPFYPDPTKNVRQARQLLRDQVYDFLKKTLCVPDNAEYIRYEKISSD